MTAAPVHTVHTGSTLQHKWGALGAATGGMSNQSPQGAISMLIGAGGSGKTTLLCSNPDCYIINCDSQSAPVANVKAGVWPIKAPDGSLIGDNGSRLPDFNWEAVEVKLNTLVSLAKSGSPRPKMVAVDTIPLAARMIQDYLTRRGGKASWKDLNGKTAWDDLYSTLIAWALILNRSGYGFVFNIHVRDAVIKLSEEHSIIGPVLSVTDGFFGRLHPVCEFIAHVYKGTEQMTVPDPRLPGRTKVELRPCSFLSTTTPGKIGEMLKSRYPLDKVTLTRDNGWQDLMTAWSVAEAKANPSSAPVIATTV